MDTLEIKILTALGMLDKPISLRSLQLKIKPNPNYVRMKEVIRKLLLQNKIEVHSIKKKKTTTMYYTLKNHTYECKCSECDTDYMSGWSGGKKVRSE